MVEPASDADLVVSSIERPELFGVVFERRYDSVWGFVFRRSDRETADELTARTFLKAFELRSRFQPNRDSALPWLYSIARALLMHHYRDVARHQRLDRTVPVDPVASLDDIDNRLVAELGWPQVIRALRTCRDVDVEVLVLTSLDGCSYSEAAEITGVAVGTIRSRLNRVRARLSELLAPLMELDR